MDIIYHFLLNVGNTCWKCAILITHLGKLQLNILKTQLLKQEFIENSREGNDHVGMCGW